MKSLIKSQYPIQLFTINSPGISSYVPCHLFTANLSTLSFGTSGYTQLINLSISWKLFAAEQNQDDACQNYDWSSESVQDWSTQFFWGRFYNYICQKCVTWASIVRMAISYGQDSQGKRYSYTPQLPVQLWGPISFLSSGYWRGELPWHKATGA
jgi:hypothetical protein